MPERPIRLREQLGEESVPIISGACKDDGSLYTIYFIPEANDGGFTREEFQYYLRTRLIDIFRENVPTDEDYENAYQAFDWFYTPWPYIEDLEANRQAINKLLTDGAFLYAWDRNAKMNSQYRDTYTYIQSFLSPNSTSFIPEWMGVPHEGELPYVWGYGYLLVNPEVRDDSGIHFDIVGWVDEDITYANYVQTLWSNFAKYGNPTPSPVQAPFNNTMTTWPKFTMDDNLKVLDLDGEISVKENYRQPENYFYTEYLSYISKHEVKKYSDPEPHEKFQLKSAMFQNAITQRVYTMMTSRFPEMSHLSLQEFKQRYSY
jgi:carboxylesterase type B